MNHRARPQRGAKNHYKKSSNSSQNGRSNGRSSNNRKNHNISPAAASANVSKYLEKAKEALSNGDRIHAENFYQHADHFQRIVIESEEEQKEKNALKEAREKEQKTKEISEKKTNPVEAAVEVIEEIITPKPPQEELPA